MRATGTIFVVAATLCAAACERVEGAAHDLEREANDAVRTADRELQRAAAEVEQLLRGTRADAEAALEGRIAALQRESEAALASARERGQAVHDELLRQLEAGRVQAEGKLAELRDASEEQWRELCRETQRATAEWNERCRQLLQPR